jgi:hypothetical protein
MAGVEHATASNDRNFSEENVARCPKPKDEEAYEEAQGAREKSGATDSDTLD